MRACTKQRLRLPPLERTTARLLHPGRLSVTPLLLPRRPCGTDRPKSRLSSRIPELVPSLAEGTCPELAEGGPPSAVHDWSISSLALALSAFRFILMPKTGPQLTWNHIDVD